MIVETNAPLPLAPPKGFTGAPYWSCIGQALEDLPLGICSRASNGSPWPGSVNPVQVKVVNGILTIEVGGAVSSYGLYETPDTHSITRFIVMQASGDLGGWGAEWFLGGPSAPAMTDGDLGEIDVNETGMINRTSLYNTFVGAEHPNAYLASTLHPYHQTPQYPYGYDTKVDLSKTWHYMDMEYWPGAGIYVLYNDTEVARWENNIDEPFPDFPESFILNVAANNDPADASWHTIGTAPGASMKIAGIGAWI